MNVTLLRIKILLMAVGATLLAVTSCKKENPAKDDGVKPPVVIQLPPSTMFVSTYNSKSGTSIYVLNASTGEVSTKYQYAYDAKAKWSAVAAGNGFLYDISANKVNAIAMNTGKVLWTDSVSSAMAPILHGDTFYGAYAINAGTYGIYALDATKPTKAYLWKTQITGETRPDYMTKLNPIIKYYNGVVYILMDRGYVTAVDANTGAIKWAISNTSRLVTTSNYLFTSINNGLITSFNSIIDVNSGAQIAMATPPVIPPGPAPGSEVSFTEYAATDTYFIQTRQFDSPPGINRAFLSAVDKMSGAEKWRIAYGGGYVSTDSTNTITEVWNNKLVIRKRLTTSAGKYGSIFSDSHFMADVNTGATSLKIDDGGKGVTIANYIAGNTMFFYKINAPNLTTPFNNQPAVSYLFAIDLSTGKQKWNNDKLVNNVDGSVSTCVFEGGKGYSQDIQ
jgi:hypothetical protein